MTRWTMGGTGALLLVSLTAGAQDQVRRYTLEEVAQHDRLKDCWTVIDNVVYDITPAVKKHPGSKTALEMACGRTASVLFKTRPMGSGTNHSAEAWAQLEKLRIGELAPVAPLEANPAPAPAPAPEPAPAPAPEPAPLEAPPPSE